MIHPQLHATVLFQIKRPETHPFILSILDKQSRGVSGSVNTFKLPSLETPDHSLWSNPAGWSQNDTLRFLSAGKMYVGECVNKHAHEVTVPSCAEKVFPVEQILDRLTVVLVHPDAHQGLLTCLDMRLALLTPETKLCTKSLQVLQLRGSFF